MQIKKSCGCVVDLLIFTTAIDMLNDLKCTPLPIPWGMYQKFNAFVPMRSPDEILENATTPYICDYAEVLREYIHLLETLPKIEFVNKKSKQ